MEVNRATLALIPAVGKENRQKHRDFQNNQHEVHSHVLDWSSSAVAIRHSTPHE